MERKLRTVLYIGYVAALVILGAAAAEGFTSATRWVLIAVALTLAFGVTIYVGVVSRRHTAAVRHGLSDVERREARARAHYAFVNSKEGCVVYVGMAVVGYGILVGATSGFGALARHALVLGSILALFVGGVFVLRALSRRRDQRAEARWQDEDADLVRIEKVEELGHTAGGLSAPTNPTGGGLSVGDGHERLDDDERPDRP